MASTFRIRAKLLARVVAPIFFATALSACSSVPDWVDPTTWIGGDSQASSDQTSDAGTTADQTTAGTDQPDATGQEAASAQPAAGDKTPDIAAIPPKPTPPSTTDEQKQVADSLAADRAQAHYSADALRGGTEAAAPPPPAETAASASLPSSADSVPPAPSDSTSPSAGTSAAASESQSASSPPSAAPVSADATESRAAPSTSPSAAPAPSEIASTDTANSSAGAAAPMATSAGVPSSQAASDMQATFAPSKAPALDPSVAQFVPKQILSHYHETAAAAAVPVMEPSATPRVRHHKKKIKASQAVIRLHYASRGRLGRTTLSLASYFKHKDGSSVSREAWSVPSHQLDRSLFGPASRAALAVVEFSHETTILDRKAQSRIQLAAQNFAASGGSGFVRVVGRAADQARNLPKAIRLRNNFERSEAQATAVARELIRDGVPAEKVLVEAIGERPSGGRALAQANRTAAIYLQS